jgi:alcohol/geraniol dehydrogenase (NADP+)
VRNNCFSANSEKEKYARKLGAHNFLNSRDPVAIKSTTNSFDLVLVTANADLDWNAYLNTLKPGGKITYCGSNSSSEGGCICANRK